MGTVNSAGGTTAGGGTTNVSAQQLSQLEAKAVTAPIDAQGRQTLDFVVNGTTRGYSPNVIKVKQGVPVHFNLSTAGADPG
jgi:hypothetical protein